MTELQRAWSEFVGALAAELRIPQILDRLSDWLSIFGSFENARQHIERNRQRDANRRLAAGDYVILHMGREITVPPFALTTKIYSKENPIE